MHSTKEKPADAACRADGSMNLEETNTMNKDSGQLVVQKTPPVEISLDAHGVQLRSFDEMARFCKAVVNSTLAPKSFDTPEKVMVAIQAGLEVGLAPMQALQSIAVVNGKPVIFGDAALALAMRHLDFEDIEETVESNVATCTIKRRGRTPVVRKFSEADAKKAQLWGKSGPWSSYPARMLQMRARSYALRDSFPDALKGLGVAEEVRDYTPRNVTTRRLAEGVVLPEAPTTAADFFDSAVKQEVLS